MPIPAKPFYMIRHGETEANAARILAGSTDSPLTNTGIKQAHEAKAVITQLSIKPAAIFHSNLSRARDTAFIINETLNVEIFEDPDLAEIHAGQLEGAPYEDCVELFNNWPHVPDGEAPNKFFERIRQGKSRAIERFNDPILIVCHGGVMRAFGKLYGLHTPSIFKNAHLYEFTPNTDKSHFPWDVYDYCLCDQTQKLIKSKSQIYESEPVDEIAPEIEE